MLDNTPPVIPALRGDLRPQAPTVAWPQIPAQGGGDGHRLCVFALIALFACLLTSPATAQRYKTVQYSNGTGFFVSDAGHVLTNAHVVEKCKWAQVSGGGMISRARIVARDADHDMALLISSMPPSATAAFRPLAKKLQKGDKVVAVGHPLGKSLAAHASELIANTGPMGERQWLQFSNSIYQGNSGGPLLDQAGQVIGMITAKSTLYRYDQATNSNKVIGNSDLAIQPYILEAFLKANRVKLRYSTSTVPISDQRIKNKAADYVVQVRCLIES